MILSTIVYLPLPVLSAGGLASQPPDRYSCYVKTKEIALFPRARGKLDLGKLIDFFFQFLIIVAV